MIVFIALTSKNILVQEFDRARKLNALGGDRISRTYAQWSI